MTRVAASLSTALDSEAAARQAVDEVRQQLAGARPDLACVFLTPDHLDTAPTIAATLLAELEPHHLLGCVSQGIVGGQRELEAGAGVALWAADLPGATITTFHIETEVAPDLQGDDDVALSVDMPDLGAPDLVTVFVDPFGFPIEVALEAFDTAHPGIPLVGGIATGAGRPRTQALIADNEIYMAGAVGAAIANVEVATVVSQGCAPVGRDAVVTDAAGNVIRELAGEAALDRLQAEVDEFSDRERELASGGLLAGLVIDENKPHYGRGDFLMRGILGADEESRGLAVAENVRIGQTIRFHVRDADSARQDLELSLGDALEGAPGRAAGALLFTCNGRGTNMFPEADHDARALAARLGQPTLAGFLCGGEIGPIGGRSFLHGFTATLAVFLDRDD